jgi:hypothetical protein
MKATPLNTKLRNSAFALALIGAASFLSGPASAGSIQNEGYFGGSWNSIGPSNYEAELNADRIGPLYGNPVYVVPAYGYVPDDEGPPVYYGAPYDYEYGPAPRDTFVGSGAAFSIGIDE